VNASLPAIRPRFLTAILALLLLAATVVGTAAQRPHRLTAKPVAATTDLAGCPRSIWHDDDTPAATVSSSGGTELGVRFRADRDGYITGIRFYKGSGNTGTHVGRLWSWNGEKLAEATFTGETGSGWQQVNFATPVRIGAGETYIAAYYAPSGHYSYTYDYFASIARIRAPLAAVKSVPGSTNFTNMADGVFHSGPGFPTSTYQATNYWVDPVFDTRAADPCYASIWTDTDVPGTPGAGGAAAIEVGVKFRASQNGYIQGVRFHKGPGNTGVHIGRLWSSDGTNLAQATFTNESPSGWQQVLFAQPVAVTAGTTYVASYYAPDGHYTAGANGLSSAVTRGPLTALASGSSGGNGVYVYGSGFPTSSYNASNYGVDVLFTATGPLDCPCGIWPGSATPGDESSTDSRATELGVRFSPLRDGYIKGVRFYKNDGNTGTHVGRLWSSTGTKLAEATFTNETANGWQQVQFATPVAVTAGTTYVASYHAPAGHYPYDPFYFSVDNTTRGPLAALANISGRPNGVYLYGSGFPTSSSQGTNYWVDVVYDPSAADATRPTVVARTPQPDAIAAPIGGAVTAGFSENVTASSVAMSVTTAGGTAVAGTTSYDSATRTARFTPSSPLAYSTDYTVTVSGASDAAGNVMTPSTWRFTTVFDPNSGPGGPIGVITSAANPYSSYYAEILRAEGLNEFTTLPVENLDAAALSGLDVAILGDFALTDDQVTTLTAWVTGGGHLIAMHPDPKLAPLLGLSASTGTLSDAYMAVDTSTAPGAGITAGTMQFHGAALRYGLDGARMIARLYSDASASTTSPAVSTKDVGAGTASAFSYDLARSVALTRQGNPAWAGQERDGRSPIRSDDMFYPNWVDLSKVAVPQADEQQRLLVNLIETSNADRKPLPRFWYLPRGGNAVVVSTGDDETPGTAGTSGRFDRYLANSPPGCDPATWSCLRFTSYLWSSVALSDAQARAYTDQGFEVALHPQSECDDWTPSSLEQDYADQLGEWKQKYYDLTPPETSRFHCIAYSDWDSQPKTELRHGIRFDANYYYWPGSWVQDRPGFMTGSGIPMRFTDTNGRMIDVYQGATDMTNESGQSYPYTPDTLLGNAVDNNIGYYGVFVANEHQSNRPSSFEDDMLVASAQNHGVPVTTARDVLHWFDARGASSFGGLSWSGNTLQFTVDASRGSDGLRGMVPTSGVGGTTLSALSRGGSPVSFQRITVKGIEYAEFEADSGAYTATYAAAAAAVTAATTSTTTAGTATVNWASGTPGSAEVAYGTSPTALKSTKVGERTRRHALHLRGLAPGTTYYYRVRTTDARGQTRSWPGDTSVASFTTPARDTRAPAISGLRVVPTPDGTVRVSWRTDEPAASDVAFGTAADRLDTHSQDDKKVTSHVVVLDGLDAGRQYHLRVGSRDVAGNRAAFPSTSTGFVTAPQGVVDQTRVGFRTGTASGALEVRGTGLADLTLAGATGSDGKPASGAFDSRILDAYRGVKWKDARWDADVPAGARLTVLARTGQTRRPDGTWSDWTPVSGSGSALDVPGSRYIQYRVQMAAGSGGVPVLHWIGFTFSGPSLPASGQ
jgi:hypothetical protein